MIIVLCTMYEKDVPIYLIIACRNITLTLVVIRFVISLESCNCVCVFEKNNKKSVIELNTFSRIQNCKKKTIKKTELKMKNTIKT